MAFQVNDNIELNSLKPLDKRLVFQTYDDMINFPSSYLYDGIITYCRDTQTYYSGTLNPVTNKIEFNEFSGNGNNKKGVDIYVLETQQEYNDLVDSGFITIDSRDLFFVLE